MPYIEIKTSTAVSAECSNLVKSELGRLITLFPGKSENYLMISIFPDCDMRFAGCDDPCCIVELKLYGKASRDACDKFTAQVTEILSSALSIPASRIYVKAEEVSIWGMSGYNF